MQADAAAVNPLNPSTPRKRSFNTAFQIDCEAFNVRSDSVSIKSPRALQLQEILHAKFKAETFETEYFSIFDYEVESWPKYVSFVKNEWDERSMNEIEAALPLIKFKKKADDWRPKPDLNDYANITILNSNLIYNELLRKLNDQSGRNYAKIPCHDFDIIGWPEGVFFYKSNWSFKNILAIYRNLEIIRFVPKTQVFRILEDDSLLKAFQIHSKILEKFWKETKRAKSQIKNYKFVPWPKCVSQSFKFWDEQAVKDIESILPIIKFVPTPVLNHNHHSIEASKLKHELFEIILEAINTEFNTKRAVIPWKSLNISNWPDGVFQGTYSWTRSEILRIYRAIPDMKFNLKTAESVVVSPINSSSTDLNGVAESKPTESQLDLDSPTSIQYYGDSASCSVIDENAIVDFLIELDSDFDSKFPESSFDDDLTKELLEILTALMGKIDGDYSNKDFDFIWSNCTVEGWPENVGFDPSKWTMQDLINIKESIEAIEFHNFNSIKP